MNEPILLTGATGNTGQVVAEELQRRGLPFVAMVRSATNRAKLAAKGIATVPGDFDDPASLEQALTGVKKAYLVCTPDEKLIQRETAFIEAAKRAGVNHVVKCSAYWADVNGETQNLRSHGRIEQALCNSGLNYTIIRPHGFMQTFTLFSWSFIQKAGLFSNPTGDGGMPLVDVRDVAQVALKALTEPGHLGKAYDVTGPAALTGDDMAETLERVLGRPVTFIPGDERQLKFMMSILGVSATPTEHVIKIMKLTREHRLERVHTTLADLGIQPTTYEQFVQDLVAGRTGGGNSFQPPDTLLVKLLDTAIPTLMNLRFRILGRPQRRLKHTQSPRLSTG